jgi:hypothetical protein
MPFSILSSAPTSLHRKRFIRAMPLGNRSAHDLLAEDVRNDSSTYPPAGLIEKLEAGMPLDARGRHRRKVLWDELRNGFI